MLATMTNTIDDVFKKRKALICYASIGDPLYVKENVDILVENGADIIEIGLPNSNPYMDGETISNSMARFRDAGVTTSDIVQHTKEIRKKYPELATVWMCYEDAKLGNFEKIAKDASVDGFIMVGFDKRDDQKQLSSAMDKANVSHIGFVSTSPSEEEVMAAKQASGYIFLQAVNGKTGKRRGPLAAHCRRNIELLRDAGVKTPIVLGFGISTPAQVRQAMEYGADGVVVGSASVAAALKGREHHAAYIRALREALNG